MGDSPVLTFVPPESRWWIAVVIGAATLAATAVQWHVGESLADEWLLVAVCFRHPCHDSAALLVPR
ncbi:hypothetical protein [Streptomyces sp. TR06-5]|uniref:hypothetical protein n=1 Tax=Streptomyces sp. TR06-5 TaxID=3385976 RepID=UPI0039A04ACF